LDDLSQTRRRDVEGVQHPQAEYDEVAAFVQSTKADIVEAS
jgi:hypothetical protein